MRSVLGVLVLFAGAVAACDKLASSPTVVAAPPSASPSVSPPVSPSVSVAPTPSPTPYVPRYVFPVAANYDYAHTHDEYPATDILAPCGTEVRAATDGVVLEVNRVDRWDPQIDDGGTRGGRFMSILGDDGVRYYGAHFSVIFDAMAPGVRVTAGEPVGQVGTTGKSSACHLHFGISPPCGRVGDWWNRRGVIWPWPYLDSWRAGGAKSAVAEITAWQTAHGCPTAPDPNFP